jgi:glycosyltransferase involved in cell wall biosynthesis
MLCCNERDTVEASVTSVVRFAESVSGEVIVVDNKSMDGSWEVLQGLGCKGLKVIRQRCTRGAARQTAFVSSSGRIVLAHMDCDDVFSADGLRNLLSIYHSKCEGRMMMTRKTGQDERSNITIAPREIIERVGGWRDINWGEDWDLWNRAAKAGMYAYLPYPSESPPHEQMRVRKERETDNTTKMLTRYRKFRDSIRIGRKVFSDDELVSLGQRLPYWLAKASVGLSSKRLDHVPLPDFDDTVPQVI